MTFKNWTEEKVIILLGHLFFLGFLFGGLLFYKERLLAFDAAYYTFHIIVNEDFFIKHNRYISYLSQWVPIVAMQAGFSLKMVLLLFSSSFMVIYYAIFALVTHGFKHPKAGLFIALSYGLCTRYKYYSAISEISISIALAGLLIAWLTRPKVEHHQHKPVLHWLVAVLLVALLFIAHPIIIIPLLFFIGFDIIYNSKWQDWQTWLFIVFLLLVYYIKFQWVQTDDYEANRASTVSMENLIKVFSNTKERPIFSVIGWYFRTEYIVPFFAFVVALVALGKAKKRLLIGYALLGTIAWLLLNIVLYAELGGFVLTIVDGYFAIFGMFWATAMYFTFLQPTTPYSKWKMAGLSFLIFFSLQRIYAYHTFYEHRLNVMLETFERHPDARKLTVEMAQFDWGEMWYPYEIPHESLMFSALANNGKAATIYVNDFNKQPEDLRKTDVFYHFDTYFPISNLPSQYFDLPDSTTYKPILDPAWVGNGIGNRK